MTSMVDYEVGVTPDRGTPVPPLVLVVDDTEGNRYAIVHLLKSVGIRVRESANGTDALAMLEDRPDLVVLDINLPDISGREILRHIRSDPEISWIPVMHVTASYTGTENHAQGLEEGADAYLTHPLDHRLFLATVRALLRLSRAESRVRRASQEWRAAFDSLTDAIFIVGSNSPKGRERVQRCNRASAGLLGLEPRDAIGLLWSDVLDRIGAPGDCNIRDLAAHAASTHDDSDIELDERWFTTSVEKSTTVDGGSGFYVCVLSDITERKVAEREKEELAARAQAARLDAESANRAKGDFLAVMSHELRTPLNAIGGYVDLLQMGIRGPVTEDQQADLARIKRSQTSLTILINDVLNFAKAESGELEYNITSFPVSEALDRASEIVEHQLAHRGLTFNRGDCSGPPLIRGDLDKVQQIILNLLSNAIKFTPSGGTITLASPAITPGIVSITVTDTGAGIPAQNHDRIFEPFVQVHESRGREVLGGVGLGLSISRDLARGMGGELSVGSSGPEGTTFLLQLPSG